MYGVKIEMVHTKFPKEGLDMAKHYHGFNKPD